jgi:hypothetical protein
VIVDILVVLAAIAGLFMALPYLQIR